MVRSPITDETAVKLTLFGRIMKNYIIIKLAINNDDLRLLLGPEIQDSGSRQEVIVVQH